MRCAAVPTILCAAARFRRDAARRVLAQRDFARELPVADPSRRVSRDDDAVVDDQRIGRRRQPLARALEHDGARFRRRRAQRRAARFDRVAAGRLCLRSASASCRPGSCVHVRTRRPVPRRRSARARSVLPCPDSTRPVYTVTVPTGSMRSHASSLRLVASIAGSPTSASPPRATAWAPC